MINSWNQVLTQSFISLWTTFINYVPQIVLAVIIFIIGWVVASSLAKVVSQLFKIAKVDHALRAAGVAEVTNRAGFELNSGKFVGEIVRWFIIVAFLIASFDILKLTQVNDFLGYVLNYLPNVIAAVLILLVAVVVGDAVKRLIVASIKVSGAYSANLLGSVAKWAIWILALFAAVTQLGIAQTFLNTLFMGIVVAISLALGLSFGLGGQEAAARTIEKIREEISRK